MISEFYMNGYTWSVKTVSPFNPVLIDRSGRRTLGTTDTSNLTLYLSSELYGESLIKVIIHELGHCAIYSFGLDLDIHKMVKPEYWIDAEEWICNFLFDYGLKIFKTAGKVVGLDALNYIPQEIERLVS